MKDNSNSTALTTTRGKGSGGILQRAFSKVGLTKPSDINDILKRAGVKSDPSVTQGERCVKAYELAIVNDNMNLTSASKEVKIVLLVDATNSMGPVWEAARSGMRKLIERILRMNPKAKIKIIAYREYDCTTIEQSAYTNDSDELEYFIAGLRLIGNLTDDEAVECGLEYTLDAKPDIAILIGDSEPHGVGCCAPAAEWQRHLSKKGMAPAKNIRSYEYVCQDLKRSGTVVHTIVTRKREEAVLSFREIADLTGGYAFMLKDIDMLIDLICGLYAKSSGQLPDLREIFKAESTRPDHQLTPGQEAVMGLLGPGSSIEPRRDTPADLPFRAKPPSPSKPKPIPNRSVGKEQINLPKRLSDDPAAQARLRELKAAATCQLTSCCENGTL